MHTRVPREYAPDASARRPIILVFSRLPDHASRRGEERRRTEERRMARVGIVAYEMP